MNRTIRSVAVALPAVALLAGCANPQATRDGAKLLAAYTGKLQGQIDRNAEARNRLAAARSWNIGLDEENAAALERENERTLAVFKIAGDEVRLDIFRAIREVTQKDIAAPPSLTPAAAPADPVAEAVVQATKARVAKLAETSKTLSLLAEPPDPKEELKFYFDFFSAVDASIQAAREKEKQQADQAAQLMSETAAPAAPASSKAEDKSSPDEALMGSMTKSKPKETQP